MVGVSKMPTGGGSEVVVAVGGVVGGVAGGVVGGPTLDGGVVGLVVVGAVVGGGRVEVVVVVVVGPPQPIVNLVVTPPATTGYVPGGRSGTKASATKVPALLLMSMG